MKKLMSICVMASLLLTGTAVASQTGLTPEGGPGDPPMPLDGTWVILDEGMQEGGFFTGVYTWNSPRNVEFTITDLFVVSDRFEVYDNAALVLTTPAVPDWDDLALAGPFVSPPWTDNPDTALASGFFFVRRDPLWRGRTCNHDPGHPHSALSRRSRSFS